MREVDNAGVSRRQMLTALGAAGALGVAGCTEGGDGGSGDDGGTAENGNGSGDVDLPSEDDGIAQWGERLNEHAREAGIDWRQFEGTELKFGMGLHPYSTTTEAVIPYFEELTGMSVEFSTFSEDQFWLEAEQSLADESGEFDGIMNGLWPAAGYHEMGAVMDLTQFIEDASLTNQDWLHMEDFREDTIELMTFPNGEGQREFTGFPNGIEFYGGVGYDKPTFETLGIDEPTNFEELEAAARQISESDEVDREGIVSRTSSTVLSSANWGTMFATHGADFTDRDAKEATLNSPEGVASLERFGGMLNEYGPENPSTKDWYANNTEFNEGNVGIIYSTPQTSGLVDPDQMGRTKWLGPLEGPDGQDPVCATWIWSTGISAFSENPEAAWLFIQWANSREANYMLSTRQWQGDWPRAGYARWDYIFERVKDDPNTPDPPDGYEQSFRDGMDAVPTDPPAVPVDTPQNMDIMSEAAKAMSSVVAGQTDAQSALDNAAPAITEHAQQIPDRYVE